MTTGLDEGLGLEVSVSEQAPEVVIPPRIQRGFDDARVRLGRLGPRSLSDGELVALLTGISSGGVLERLMGEGLRALMSQPLDALLEQRALKENAGIRLAVAGELARRLLTADEPRTRLTTPQAIYEYARPHLIGLRREEFHVLCINSRNVLLRHVRVAEGSVDQCHVDPREVFAPAIATRATGVILFHNHPSGDPEPSVHDVALTRQLREGARLMCVRLLDHLVIGDHSYVSLLARGLIDRPESLSFTTRRRVTLDATQG